MGQQVSGRVQAAVGPPGRLEAGERAERLEVAPRPLRPSPAATSATCTSSPQTRPPRGRLRGHGLHTRGRGPGRDRLVQLPGPSASPARTGAGMWDPRFVRRPGSRVDGAACTHLPADPGDGGQPADLLDHAGPGVPARHRRRQPSPGVPPDPKFGRRQRGISFAKPGGHAQGLHHRLLRWRHPLRLRPSYFRSPAVGGYDINCLFCLGEAAARPAARTGWMGSAAADGPATSSPRSATTPRWSGFAFGFGTDRLSMNRHGINDIHGLFTQRHPPDPVLTEGPAEGPAFLAARVRALEG